MDPGRVRIIPTYLDSNVFYLRGSHVVGVGLRVVGGVAGVRPTAQLLHLVLCGEGEAPATSTVAVTWQQALFHIVN